MGTEGPGGSSAKPDGSRKIIHIDMDAFYASVEQRDNPELRGKPVAVGGSRERGVVAAASYEARKFGVHSAMPSITAKRKCPDLIFVKPRFDAYKAISLQIREIFAEYTPVIEPLSLDEAYLDVTENLKGIASATQIAEESGQGFAPRPGSRPRPASPTTSSSPSSPPTTASRTGCSSSRPKMGPEFVETLPVRKFHGVGPATAAKMGRLGIKTGLDLRAQTLAFLQQHFGKAGPYYYWAARGVDERPVRADRIRKSVGAENTFPPISSPTKPRAMRFERSSTRCGGIARVPVFAAAPSRSRSSSPTSSRSREAAPVRCRSGRAANSNSSATHCSNLSSLSREAFGSWASPCLRSDGRG